MHAASTTPHRTGKIASQEHTHALWASLLYTCDCCVVPIRSAVLIKIHRYVHPSNEIPSPKVSQIIFYNYVHLPTVQ